MKILLIIMMSILPVMALTNSQKQKIQKSYEIGKSIKASDGMTFALTLPSIMGQESSWGVENIGDKYDSTGRLKSLYDSSLGNFQIKLSTAKLTILKYPKLRKKYGHLVNKDKSTYKKYEKHYNKLKYYKSILNSEKWNNRAKKGDKKALRTLSWAKREYLYHYEFYKKYKKEARKDTLLINKLMYDFEFGATIGGHYLLSMYEEALKKFGKKEAYWRAVGRYNGGWHNKGYHNRIVKKMKIVKKYI